MKKKKRNHLAVVTESNDCDVCVGNEPVVLRDDIPGYHFIRLLGHGSQGKVYLAERLSDHLKVAVKQLNIDSVKNWKSYDLFKREAAVLESLDISGVAKFYEAIERLDDNPPCSYIVQEYVEGRSLGEMLKAGHRFSLQIVFAIVLQLLDILNQLHTHQPPVIHRDIKPSNIILRSNGADNYQVYLMDFGAVANPQIQGGGSTIAGTYGFMPPEQLMGKTMAASDIYSLAAVIVNLLSGKSPADMPVKDFRLIFEPDMQNMMPAVVAVLRRMLEPKVENRLSDYNELKKIFTRFSNNDFSMEMDDVIHTKEDFIQKLLNVTAYGQHGNFELWQQLSDHVPRPPIKIYENHKIDYYISKSVFKEDGIFYRKKDESNHKNLGMMIGITIFSVFIFSIPVLFILAAGLEFTVIMVLFATIVAGISIADSSVMSMYKEKPRPNENLLKLSSFDLLRNGRKTIATIVKIEYKPASQAYLTVNPLFQSYRHKSYESNLYDDNPNHDAKSDYDDEFHFMPDNGVEIDHSNQERSRERNEFDMTADHWKPREFEQINRDSLLGFPEKAFQEPDNLDKICLYLYRDSPAFRVYYKFNPLDDSSSEDLIHSFVTHVEPEDHYQVGDPLPILYKVDVEDGTEYVSCIPFPVPLKDFRSWGDLLSMTEKKL